MYEFCTQMELETRAIQNQFKTAIGFYDGPEGHNHPVVVSYFRGAELEDRVFYGHECIKLIILIINEMDKSLYSVGLEMHGVSAGVCIKDVYDAVKDHKHARLLVNVELRKWFVDNRHLIRDPY